MITRHILTIRKVDGSAPRKVHYRRCGNGPVLLMIHQSPRSSKEYEAQMLKWGEHFTCIAPDTAGFGQSDPLVFADGEEPHMDHFAHALCEFIEALGIAPALTYGFHSGAIIAVSAMKQRPDLFRALALGGYAIWTQKEMEIFGDKYLQPFHPSAYGEHMTWLWSRIMEQSWFFPWFDSRDVARLPNAHQDLDNAQAWADDFLDSGDAYRAGYGAVLRANRDLPTGGSEMPPGLITAYFGDPLQEHIDRLETLPEGWEAYKVDTPQDQLDASLEFLLQHVDGEGAGDLPEDDNEGWLAIDGGLIHWKGKRGAARLILHAPAGELAEPGPDEIAIDLPGHGQTDDFADVVAVIEQAKQDLGASQVVYPDLPVGDPQRLYPDLTPDRYGSHFQRAWIAARTEAFFAPWYEAKRDHATTIDQNAITPAAIHARAVARLRAGREAAIKCHQALASLG